MSLCQYASARRLVLIRPYNERMTDLNRVLLPAPRNPVRIVNGTLAAFCSVTEETGITLGLLYIFRT
jgi:hypothetical protein